MAIRRFQTADYLVECQSRLRAPSWRWTASATICSRWVPCESPNPILFSIEFLDPVQALDFAQACALETISEWGVEDPVPEWLSETDSR